VGAPVESISVRIIRPVDGPVDSFDSLLCDVLEPGEICVAGDHVLKEYFGGDEARLTKISDEGVLWHRTGDAGYLSDDGDLYLMGREKHRFEFDGVVRYRLPYELLFNGSATVVLQHGKPVVVSEATQNDADVNGMAVIHVDALPRDPRHRSKIDYDQLESMVDRL
jgi:acyl-CoA synthetase (AMP-forming)/AMP-acid ligase II